MSDNPDIPAMADAPRNPAAADRMRSSPVDSAPALTTGSVWIAGIAKSAPKLLWVRDQLAKLDEVEEAYVPTVKQARVVYGREREFETPIAGWGRYFFVRLVLDAAGGWAKARYQDGVQALLPAHCPRPLAVSERFINQIRAEIEGGQHQPRALVQALRRYLAGEAVDVVKGPLLAAYPDGISGEVESHSLRHGVKVKLSCPDGLKVVTLPADQLAPSGSERRQTRPGGHRRRQRMRAPPTARAAI